MADFAALRVVRLASQAEEKIADLAEGASQMFADADIAETSLGSEANRLLEDLMSGDWTNFVPFTAQISDTASAENKLAG